MFDFLIFSYFSVTFSSQSLASHFFQSRNCRLVHLWLSNVYCYGFPVYKMANQTRIRHVVGTHEKRAFEVFQELREHDELLDVTLKVDEQEIKAHRIVLAACSSYFRAMLTTGFVETFMSTISIQDCDPKSVKQIIDYFYTRELAIDQENIEGILSVASLFEVPEVVQECGEFMQEEIQLDNCLGIQSLASQFSLTNLKSKVDNFISWNFMALCVEEEFGMIPAGQLAEIISQDTLHVEQEEDVFEALMAWYEEDEQRIDKHKDLMKHIRFMCMSPEYLEEMLCDETFSEVPIWEELVQDALQAMSSPSKKNHYIDKPRQSPFVLYLIGELFNSKIETFNMDTGVCSEVEGMAEASGTALVVNNNLYLVVGGGLMVDRYNVKSNCWVRVTDGVKEAEYASCEGMGHIFVIGGGKRAKFLDLKSKTWNKMPMMSMRRSYHAIVALNGKIYVSGGVTPPGDQATASVECFNTETGQWEDCAPMTVPRFRHELVVLNDATYAIGGCDRLGSSFKTVETFDPKSNCWTSIAALNHPRRDFAAGVLQGVMFVFGGGSTTTIEQYNQDMNKWTVVGSLKKRWSNFRCVSFPYIRIKDSRQKTS